MIASGIFSQIPGDRADRELLDVVSPAVPIAARRMCAGHTGRKRSSCARPAAPRSGRGRSENRARTRAVRAARRRGLPRSPTAILPWRGRVDLAEMVRHLRAGPCLEAGQLLECDVELDGAAGLRHGQHSARQAGSAASPRSERVILGSALETTNAALDSLAACELDSAPGNDARDRRRRSGRVRQSRARCRRG